MMITAAVFPPSSLASNPLDFRAGILLTIIRKMSDALHIMAFRRKPADVKRALIIELHQFRCTATDTPP